MSINGTAHQVSMAPPVRYQSVRFIEVSIAIIEIMLIPMAVLNASAKLIPARFIIIVSNNMLVIRPFTIANVIIARVGQGMWVYRKKPMVAKSPIAQPIKHHLVLCALLSQVCLHCQKERFILKRDIAIGLILQEKGTGA